MQTIRALPWLICLCALPLLQGCGRWPTKPQVISRPTVIEVPVTRWREIPDELTAELVPPAPPPRRCRDARGEPAVCVIDALDQLALYQAIVALANQDRQRVRALSRTGKEAP